MKQECDTNWTFSSFADDLNGNVSDQEQNGLEGNSNNQPNGVVVKAGHKLLTTFWFRVQSIWSVCQSALP